MLFENLLVERNDAVAVLTVNRPKSLNALNRRTLGELGEALAGFRSEVSARCIIITGAGDRAFIAAKPAVAVRYCIDAINEGLEMSFAEGCQHEAVLFGLVTATDDMREGTRAFLEKRKLEFKGE
jgi:enoyl-CoA hydratase/carnithine racemase